MTTQYPGGLDQFPVHTDNINETIAAQYVNNLQDAVTALEKRFNVSGLSSFPPISGAGNMCVVSNQWYVSDGQNWNAMSAQLQPATSSVLGGVKVGNGLNVTVDGTLSTSGPSRIRIWANF